MKVTYELFLDDRDDVKYAVRAAALFEMLAADLRFEACGGQTVSSPGNASVLGTERLVLVRIEKD